MEPLDQATPDAQNARQPVNARQMQGVLLFVDLAGFSRMSTDLVAQDARGAEQIMEKMNHVFDPIISAVARHGGRVIASAGDALLAFWDTADVGALSPQHAQTAAQAILALPQIDTEGGGQISIKLLLDAGPLNRLDLGGHHGETRGVYGGLLIHNLAQRAPRLVPQTLTTTPAFDAAFSATQTAISGAEPTPPTVPAPPSLPLVSAEFRTVAVLFAKLPVSLLEDPQAAQQATLHIQNAIATQSGALVHFQSDDKGLIAIGAWGVAHSAHEGKSARAVFAARQIAGAMLDQGVAVQMGVTTGTVLSGVLGNQAFQQATIVSQIVNLAAFLAESAQTGQILCGPGVAALVQERFALQSAGHLVPKGATSPLQVFEPTQERAVQPRFDQALIGRSVEFDQVMALFGTAAADLAPLVQIIAPAGLGKSHLGAAVAHSQARAGVRVLTGYSDALRQTEAYRAWRSIFSALLRATPDRILPDVLNGSAVYAALLNPVLDQQLPETAECAALSPTARSQLTGDLMIDLLRQLLGTQRTLLVFEDTHWLDSASWALIARCRRALPALGVLTLTRPVPETEQPMSALEVLGHPASTTIPLSAFDRTQSDALVAAEVSAREIPPALGALIFDLAAGNPLYTKEQTKLIMTRGILRVANGYCHISTGQIALDQVGFPADLGTTLTERVDGLGDQAKQLLKTASVQGRNIDLPVLRAVFQTTDGGTALSFDALLDECVDAQLIEIVDARRCRFHHALISEAAYALLLRAEQSSLHHRTAQAMEQVAEQAGQDIGTDKIGLLAYHWEHAGDPARTLPYLDRALQTALAQHAKPKRLDLANAPFHWPRRILDWRRTTRSQAGTTQCRSPIDRRGISPEPTPI